MMPTSEPAREAEPLHIAKRYVSCYNDQMSGASPGFRSTRCPARPRSNGCRPST